MSGDTILAIIAVSLTAIFISVFAIVAIALLGALAILATLPGARLRRCSAGSSNR